ncbi:desmethyl-deoxy-podophyllotoxin synthase-like [Cornus florida]|uniref:desmethyl-deoxy-podophyllotoxin synthase-like n=1 Tax=Cornus florida TaxID=4283 RepID=UPI0028981873|nr:desmethyl-deoxy-podophyllotoxin synthase-like [Cornus florida]
MELQLPSLPLFFTFLLFLSLLVKHWKQSKAKSPTQKLPPGPRKLPVIGNLHQLIGSLPHHSLRDLANKYGPIMHLQLGEVSALVISSPEAAKEVMKTHDLTFATRPDVLACKIMSYDNQNIVFAPYGQYWRQIRKICILELLSAKRVQSFRSLREEEVHNLIDSISSSPGIPINLSQKISSMTNDIIARAAIGKKCKDQDEFISVVEEVIKLSSGFDVHDIFPSLKFLHLICGGKPNLEKLHQRLDKIFDDIINEHKLRRKTTTINGEEDLVDVLLNLQERGDLEFPITTDNIKAVILDMIAAGTETSSTATIWTLSEMMRNPGIMEKAQAEVRQVLKGKSKIEEMDIWELHYLKLVIKETLRLHPPAPLLVPREARERCEINGYDVPIKTKVIVNAWAIGRDPKSWTNAKCFEPERFRGSSIDFKGTNFEYIPFGAGRRICPGISFGIANIELPLAQLLYHFDWKLPNGIKPEEFDMKETFGATARRINDLHLVGTPYIPSIQENREMAGTNS